MSLLLPQAARSHHQQHQQHMQQAAATYKAAAGGGMHHSLGGHGHGLQHQLSGAKGGILAGQQSSVRYASQVLLVQLCACFEQRPHKA